MKKTTTETAADDIRFIDGDFFSYYTDLLKKDPKQLESYRKHIVDEYNKNHDTALFLEGLKIIAAAEGKISKLAKEIKVERTKKQDKDSLMRIEMAKQQRETKSKALTLLVKPSTYKALKKEASSKTMSVNEVANQLFEQHVASR
jgi:predicted HicB family RNase H-like nuclease